jgi:hypothetical protein
MARRKKEIFKPRIFTKLHEWGSAYALRGYGVMKWLRTDCGGRMAERDVFALRMGPEK